MAKIKDYETFDLWQFSNNGYKITKPIRLIELFAGLGSQNLALKYLGANYEHWRICEWAWKSFKAYNDIHIKDYTDYAKDMTKEQLVSYLLNKGISDNYNEPMNKKQLNIRNIDWLKERYNDIIATNNLVNIMTAKGDDFGIKETDKYEYIMTYSFPCQ